MPLQNLSCSVRLCRNINLMVDNDHAEGLILIRYASMSRFNFIPNSVISPTWCDVSTFDHVMFCFYNINLQYFICTRFMVVSLLREACYISLREYCIRMMIPALGYPHLVSC